MSQVVEALEAIQVCVRSDYYVILHAPKIKTHGENYIQALAMNSRWTSWSGPGNVIAHYRCELRISGATRDGYQQWCLMLPEEIGLAGTPEKDQLC